MLAWYLKFGAPWVEKDPTVGVLSMGRYFSMLWYVIPLYIALYYFFNLYKPKRTLRNRYEIFNILKANVVGVILLIVILYMIDESDISRIMLFWFFAINIVLTTLFRSLVRYFLHFFRQKG